MLGYIIEQVEHIFQRGTGLSNSEKKLIEDEVKYALNQTRLHIAQTRTHSKDIASSQLSNIWRRVGSRLSDIGNESVRCYARTIEEKSKYWSDPNNYDRENLEKYEMYLTQVEDKLKFLL